MIDGLVACLGDSKRDVRQTAAEALGWLTGKQDPFRVQMSVPDPFPWYTVFSACLKTGVRFFRDGDCLIIAAIEYLVRDNPQRGNSTYT